MYRVSPRRRTTGGFAGTHAGTRAGTRAGTLAALTVTALLTACSGDEDEARGVLDQFLAGWTSGQLAEVPFVDAHGKPLPGADVAAKLTSLAGELTEPPELTVEEMSDADGLATARVGVAWPLPDGATWSYPTTVRLQDGEDGWRVIWTPGVVHPELVPGDELALRRQPASRGEILDGSGKTIMGIRPVKDIGIWPSRVSDVDALVTDLRAASDRLGVDLDETLAQLPDQIAQARADDLRVPVVTLRAGDYAQVEDILGGREEILVDDDEWYLAPSRAFARALIGTVGDVTAELVEAHPGVYEQGDQAGLSGLSRQYDERLRGVPGQQVVVERDEELELGSVPPEPGADLTLTLDITTQRAAEAALAAEPRPSALVAIRISDGAVLAVANTEGEAANPVNIALTGAVPPGSVFKAVTAYRLLDTGEVSLDTPVSCPAEYEAGGFPVRNAFPGDRGEIPFRQAVAISCNTAFAALAPKLGGGGLASAGAALGVGGEWDLGTETFTGSVGTGGSEFEQAQAAFGQGKTLVSPAALAVAMASLARGAWLPPSLVVDPEAAPPTTPTPLNESAAADVRSALRAVVTDGTASALAGVPGGDVFGKTGSAEAGKKVTHAWFAGWQGDLAFAIFIENGESGSGGAVPLAGDFLRRLA